MASSNPQIVSLYTCPRCLRDFHNASGLTQHQNTFHRDTSPDREAADDGPLYTYQYHPSISGMNHLLLIYYSGALVDYTL